MAGHPEFRSTQFNFQAFTVFRPDSLESGQVQFKINWTFVGCRSIFSFV